jgi:putative transposase
VVGFTSALADRKITISVDGKDAWRDNVFVERLWRRQRVAAELIRIGGLILLTTGGTRLRTRT